MAGTQERTAGRTVSGRARTALDSPRRPGPRQAILALAVAAALAPLPPARANPEGGQVVAGSASITRTSPKRVDVRQGSDRAVVDWRSFSIDTDEHTHFQQPSPRAATLNRVKGADPSRILGQLSANGQVMLVNPNGVFFGRDSRVDVGALMATTADIADADFMVGRYRFAAPSPNPDAGVVNLGEIRAAEGGFVVLAAPHVRNAGTVEARLGQVVLGGASTFTVDFDGDGLLQFAIGEAVAAAPRGEAGQPVDALVSNSGTVTADGGRVTLTARAAGQIVDRVINLEGVVQARTVEARGGTIVLGGGEAGTVAVSGTLDASGPAAGERGGTVKVLGEKVGLFDGAVLDASGAAGGGRVLVGGGFRGQGPEPNARRTYVAPGARLTASALDRGDGGRVVVWADEAVAVYGQVAAAGGPGGGDGGLVELSGKQYLDFRADVDLGGPKGKPGTLLLDPLSITIVAGAGADDDEVLDGEILEGDRPGDALVISEEALEGLAEGLNVVLEATDTITIEELDDAVLSFAATTGSVTFRAGGAFQVADFLTVETQGGGLAIEAAELAEAPEASGSLVLRTNGGNISVQARAGAIAGSVSLFTDSSSADGPGGDITVSAEGDLFMGGRGQNVDARGLLGGGRVELASATGVADLGNVDTSSADGQGGALTITAAGDVNTGELVTRGATGGGAVSVTSTGGSIATDFATEGFPLNPIDAASDAGPAGDVTLTAAGDLQVGAIDATGVGGGDVTLTAASLQLTDGVGGSGALLLQPLDPDDGIAIGSLAEGFEGLALEQDLLALIDEGFSAVTIGRANGRHAIEAREVDFEWTGTPVTVRTPDGGSILVASVEGGAGITSAGPLTLVGPGGTTTLEADILTSGDPIEIDDAVTLAADVTLDTTFALEGSGGGDIRLLGPVDGAQALVLVAGDGAITLAEPAGGTTALASLTASGASLTLNGVRTGGAQTYAGALGLAGTFATGGGAFEVDGPVTLAGDTRVNTAGGAITFGGTVDSDSGGGPMSLTLAAGTGSVTLGRVGGSAALEGLRLTSAGSLDAAGIRAVQDVYLTADAMALGGAVAGAGTFTAQPLSPTRPIVLGGVEPQGAGLTALYLSATELARISSTFDRVVIGRPDGRHAITIADAAFRQSVLIQTPEGGQTVVGPAGAGTGLFGFGSVTLVGSGATTYLDAGIATSGGPITIYDSIVLRADVTLEGGGIYLFGPVDGPFTLTLLGGGGDVVFGGGVGTTTRPRGVTVGSARNVSIDNRFLAGDASFTLLGRLTSVLDALLVDRLFIEPGARGAGVYGSVDGQSGPDAAQVVEGPVGDPDFTINDTVIGLQPEPPLPFEELPAVLVQTQANSLVGNPAAAGGQPLRLPVFQGWVVAPPQFLAGDPSEAQFSNFGNEELWGQGASEVSE